MRIGCLGAARIAPPALVWPAKVRGGAVLQTVAARDPDRAAAFAETHGFARHDRDYAAVIAAPDVELIYNPLPINLHAEWTIRALEAGKHVLCEKPFAMNLDEAEAMVAAARKSGRRLIEAFHYRFHPGFAQLLAWVREGRIGAVRSLEGRFNVPISDRGGEEIRHLPETGGGAFMDLGCYPLSWTLAVMQAGPSAVRAEARLTPRGVDEAMRAELDFASGAVATLETSMAQDAGFAAFFKVVGECGEISFTNPLAPQIGSHLALTVDGFETVAPVSRIATYLFQLDAIIDALETGTETPMEGETILRQQSALDAVYRAAGLEALRRR
jgi:predicted dehydrogenase